MKNLWIVSKIPEQGRTALTSRLADKDDILILIQDGTYHLLKEDFMPVCPVYALRTDVIARGIQTDIGLITYADLVDLIFQCKRTITV